jgi:hypothetical protein
MVGVTLEDRRIALKRDEALGLTRDTLDLYGLYYAFRFPGALRENDGLFRWCVRTIRDACIRGDCEELRRHGHSDSVALAYMRRARALWRVSVRARR